MSIHAVPRLPPRLAPRRRLIDRLEQDNALTVLRAPGGYGKTAVLTQWATGSARTGIWIRAQEGLGEPPAFVQAVATGLDDAGLLDDDNPLRTSAESVAMGDPFALLRRGLRRIPGPLMLVLDEAEHLDPATVSGLLGVLTDDPEVSLRVATRRADAFTEPALRLTIDVDVIDVDDLALSASEASTILRTDSTDEAVTFVLEHGASAALARIVSLAGTALGEEDTADAVESAIESLLRLRAPTWDHDFIEFLRVVALSEIMDAELAAELSGRPDAAELLDRAELEGMGYWRVPPTPGDRHTALFVSSPVFRRILDRSARKQMDSRWVRNADRKIAHWHLAAGRAYPALQSAVHARDGELITEVVRLHWSDLFRSASDVRELFRGVPLLSLRAQPLPTMLLAILWNALDAHRLKALEYFALAAYGARTRRASATPADRALLGAIESAAYRVSGRTDRAVRTATATLQVMQEMGPQEQSRLGRNSATVYNQIGLAFMYGGRREDAVRSFRLSDAVGRELGLRAGLQGLSHLAGTLALSGDLADAREVIARARSERWPDGWRDGYSGSMLRLAEAILCLESGQPDRAAEELAPLAPHRATIEHAGLFEYVETLIQLMAGDTDAAARRLRRVDSEQRRLSRLGGLGGEKLRTATILVALARGDRHTADGLTGKLPAGPVRGVSRARVLLAAGDTDGALRVLAATQVDQADLRLRAEHVALTAGSLALVARTLGRGSAALQAAVHALHESVDLGLTIPLLLVPTDALSALASIDCPAPVAAAVSRARERTFIPSGPGVARLTDRERAVAQSLASDETVAEIATRLSVSPNTVKSQMRAVYRKLGVRTRDDAVRVLAAEGGPHNRRVRSPQATGPSSSGAASPNPDDARPGEAPAP